MDFSFSADQLSIQDSMSRIFADYCADDAIKKLSRQDVFFHAELWQQLSAAGVCALPFDEGGLGLVEMCLILELQGQYVAPLPLIPSIVEAGMTIQASGNSSLIESVLPECASGDAILSPISEYRGLQSAEPLAAREQGGEMILHGRSSFAPYAAQAKGFIVSLNNEQGEAIVVYCETDAVSVVAQTGINDEPAGYVEFDNVVIANNHILARGGAAQKLIESQRQRAWVASAAVLVGALDEGLKRTAGYVSERKQFGRALGSFQAVSQQAADAYMELESLRSVYWRALEDCQDAANFSVSAAVAKFYSVEASHKVAHAVLHLHGGIGQDLDYPIHRFFLFAKAFERYLGDADDVALNLGSRLLAAHGAELEELCQ